MKKQIEEIYKNGEQIGKGLYIGEYKITRELIQDAPTFK